VCIKVDNKTTPSLMPYVAADPPSQITCPLTFSDSFCMTCDDTDTTCKSCPTNYYPNDVTGKCSKIRSGNSATPTNMVNNVRTYDTGNSAYNFMSGITIQGMYC